MRSAKLLLPLLLGALVVSGCGLAKSIAERYAGDGQVVLWPALDRSGTVIRTQEGRDLEVRPGSYAAGDTSSGAHALSVFAFHIDASQEPENVKLSRATLVVWFEPDSGDPQSLAPVVISHLPDHPSFPLTPGQVPHPAGTTVRESSDASTAGWRHFDITRQLQADWYGGRSISAFAIRLANPSNNDLQADRLLLSGRDANGDAANAHVVLEFSADL